MCRYFDSRFKILRLQFAILKFPAFQKKKKIALFLIKKCFFALRTKRTKGGISVVMCRQTGNREMSNRTRENGAESNEGRRRKKERRRYIGAHIFMS